MNTLLGDWMRRLGDSWSLDFDEPLENRGQLTTYRTFYSLDEYRRWQELHRILAPQLHS